MNYGKEANRILQEFRRENEQELRIRKEIITAEIPDYSNLERELKAKGLEYMRISVEGEEGGSLEKLEKELSKIQKEMENLLLENGYPKDYLEKQYHCSICQDEGVVQGAVCECKKKIMVDLSYEKSEIQEKLINENFDHFNLDLFRETRKENESYSPREMMENIYAFSKKYIQSFPHGESLLLSGAVGVGKTFLCSSIAKEILDKGHTVIYQSSPQLMKFLWDYYYSSFDERDMMRKKYEMLIQSDLLVIDDLGTESISDSGLSHFFDLLNNRLQNHKSMIISTNLELEDIRHHYDERISSRILGEFSVLSIYGEDLRLKKLGL